MPEPPEPLPDLRRRDDSGRVVGAADPDAGATSSGDGRRARGSRRSRRRGDAGTRWGEDRRTSILVFGGILAVLAVASLVLTWQVVDVLPSVGQDQLGDDNWDDPIGLQAPDGVPVAHIPDCAAGAVTRIVLWNADSEPYWEVVGRPTPMTNFFVGVTPEGFLPKVEYREPPRGEVLRLVVFREVGGTAGIRYRAVDLPDTRVVSGQPLTRFTIEGFKTADVCGQSGGSVTTTEPGFEGDAPATTAGG